MGRIRLADLDWRSSTVVIPSDEPERSFLEYRIRVGIAWTL